MLLAGAPVCAAGHTSVNVRDTQTALRRLTLSCALKNGIMNISIQAKPVC